MGPTFVIASFIGSVVEYIKMLLFPVISFWTESVTKLYSDSTLSPALVNCDLQSESCSVGQKNPPTVREPVDFSGVTMIFPFIGGENCLSDTLYGDPDEAQ